jgi:SAM-dependent methyltransferase
MNSRFELIKADVCCYYTDKVLTFGSEPKGVDWNSIASQELRFEQLLKVCDFTHPLTINDYGCGYGHLVEYMTHHNYSFQYNGFDISDEMITRAKEKYSHLSNVQFFAGQNFEAIADYTIASGVFNVKLNHTTEDWQEYTLATIHKLNSLSSHGFAFNILTSYSDKEYMREDLYYAAPCFYFDYCKQNFSKNVALLHDYGLYEFTILVRKA